MEWQLIHLNVICTSKNMKSKVILAEFTYFLQNYKQNTKMRNYNKRQLLNCKLQK